MPSRLRYRRQELTPDPVLQGPFGRTGPLLLLGLAPRYRVRLPSFHFGDQPPDVMGQVDILGEPVDRAVRLRQRSPTLEHQITRPPGSGDPRQGLHHPDILLENG